MNRRTAPSCVRQWAFCLTLALAGALVSGPRAASAQDVSSLQGTFVWDSIASDDVGEALEAAVDDLNVLHRRFAAGHLQGKNRPYRTITIQQGEETISISTDGGEPIRAPASGEPIQWTHRDGKRMRVSIVRDEGTIRQKFMADDEERENLFRPSADGRDLELAVTVRMDHLPNPIRYELVYRPVDGRMREYLWRVAGPGPLTGTFVAAGFAQLFDVPKEWDRDWGGYGRRVASSWGRLAIQTTVTHGLAAALDRPTTDYRPCPCLGRGQRARHALLGTITDPASEGGRTLAVPRIAGVYAGAFAELAWTPGNVDAGDALISGTERIVASAIGNLIREFLGSNPLTHLPGIFSH